MKKVKPLYLIKLLINLYLRSKLTSSKVQHSVPVFVCQDIKFTLRNATIESMKAIDLKD